MRSSTLARSIAALGTLSAAAWADQAYAIEPGSVDPHMPGFTDGAPLGALPPPGLYFINTAAYVDGTFQNNNGHPLPVNITAWVEEPAVEWVTPFHFLGASYAMAFLQPLATLSVTTPGGTTNRTGLTNTVLTPAILSWKLPAGFFASASFVLYLDDGDTGDRGNGTNTQQHLSNNTTTFAPSGAVSWFNGHGLETSLNFEYDIQTQNDNFDHHIPGTAIPASVGFQSGDILNLDFTAVQVLPGAYKKWTVGAVGYYSTQTTDDQLTINGVTTTVANNRYEKFGLGPYAGYDFGPIRTNFWYTRDLFAKNTTLGDTFWFQFAIPL